MFRSARGPMVWLVPLAVIVLATVLIGVVIANQGPSDDNANAHSQSEAGSGSDSEVAVRSGEEVDLSFVEHRVEDDSRARRRCRCAGDSRDVLRLSVPVLRLLE